MWGKVWVVGRCLHAGRCASLGVHWLGCLGRQWAPEGDLLLPLPPRPSARSPLPASSPPNGNTHWAGAGTEAGLASGSGLGAPFQVRGPSHGSPAGHAKALRATLHPRGVLRAEMGQGALPLSLMYRWGD